MITQALISPINELDKSERIEKAQWKVDCIINEMSGYFDHRNVRATEGDYYSRKSRNAFCRKLWNNTTDSSDYDYLYGKFKKEVTDPSSGDTRIIELVPPARVRNIPIVRPMLESLVSRMSDRPLRPRCYSVGTDAVQDKLDVHINRLSEMRNEKLQERIAAVALVRRGIEMQEQLLQQLQEQGGEDPRLEQMLMVVRQSIEQSKMVAQRSIRITDEEREKVSNFYKYSYKDLYEQATEGLLFEYIDRNRLNNMRVEGFQEKMITDEPYVLVWWEEGMVEPTVKMYRPEQVTYPIVENTCDARDLDYCVLQDMMSYGQIIEMWGHKMTDEQVERLRYDAYALNDSNGAPFPYGTMVWGDTLPDGRRIERNSDYMNNFQQQISVYRTFWKEVVKMKAVEKFFDDGQKYYEPIPEGYKPKKGERIVNKVKMELWYDICVGYTSRIHITTARATWQPRPIGKPGGVYLPLAGKAVSRYRQPNSQVWTTRDIQELFNILHHTEEKLVVLSGVKGIVYDLSQKPEGMSEQEVIYYMKQGILFIETVTNGNRKNQSFNQFPSYDQTLSPAIAAITNIKNSLIELVRMITGVMPQLQGQISPTDQVGTSQIALAMSTASVEYLYQEDGMMWQQALEMLANIFPIVYRDKGVTKIHFDGTKQHIVAYPKEVDGEFAAVVDSGTKAQAALERARAGIEQAYAKGIIGIGQLIQMQDLQSIHDIQNAINDFESKAQAMMEGQQNQQMQQQMTLQQQAKQMEAQLTMQIEQSKGQMAERLAQLQGQIELQKIQMQNNVESVALQQAMTVEQMKDATKRYDIQTNTIIEASYLELEKQKLDNAQATARLDRTLSHVEAQMKHSSDVRKAKGNVSDR